MLKIEILTTGDELLEGTISDTNAAYIARELQSLGLTVQRINTVGDELEALRATLLEISSRADLCVMSGGLGPTSDDLTLDALALSAGVELEHSEPVWAHIQAYYQKLKRSVPPSNKKQARVPRGGEPLLSDVGTAPGMRLKVRGCEFFAYPGVPSELRWHLSQSLLPYLEGRLGQPVARLTLRVGALGESALQDRLNTLPELSTGEVRVGYQALGAEVRLKLSAPSEAPLKALLPSLRTLLGSHLISEEDRPLHEEVLALCRAQGVTLGCAESCTGGRVSAALTTPPGASSVFMGGVVSYSNEVKQRALGVREATLIEVGAVSERCALEMASGAQRALNVDWALSITGVAGPGGGSVEKPVGTVWFAWVGPHGSWSELKHFLGARERVQERAAYHALFVLKQLLTGERT